MNLGIYEFDDAESSEIREEKFSLFAKMLKC